MDDLISRQEALNHWVILPERNIGYWYDGPYPYDLDGTHYIACSVCDKEIANIDETYPKFCPNCGSRMMNGFK